VPIDYPAASPCLRGPAPRCGRTGTRSANAGAWFGDWR